MISFLIGVLTLTARASELDHSVALHLLNGIYYTDDLRQREALIQDLDRILPPIADFYARAGLPELALHYQQRAIEGALLKGRAPAAAGLSVRADEWGRAGRQLMRDRAAISRVDLARVVQLSLTNYNRVPKLEDDRDEHEVDRPVREGLRRSLEKLPRPLDDATVATLFAVVSNPHFDARLRRDAFENLAWTGREELAPMLMYFAADRNSSTALARVALEVFAAESWPGVLKTLIQILENRRAPEWARRLAAEGMGHFPNAASRAVLEVVAWRELDGIFAIGLAALGSLERVGTSSTYESMSEHLEFGSNGPRKRDAIRASAIALAKRLGVSCEDLLKKKD